jgi:hypothetical protein
MRSGVAALMQSLILVCGVVQLLRQSSVVVLGFVPNVISWTMS